MFFFGNDKNENSTPSWDQEVRDKYGMSKNDEGHVVQLIYQTFGTNKLDYVFERFAPQTLGNVKNVETSSIWQGRYIELQDQYKKLLTRYDELQRNYNELAADKLKKR